ncbi:MAG: bifunctional glutamate N-acetyltransferase/amino-acid acetyltransferase ArgJ [Acidimicrobiales bacterium]
MGEGASLPRGFFAHVANVGVKDSSLDFSIVASVLPCSAAGVFTRSTFAGPSVALCRSHLQDGSPRAIVTVSKNANVATGQRGADDAAELARLTARVIGSDPVDVLVASTGVIGRPYPMERLRAHFEDIEPLEGNVRAPSWTAQLADVAQAMMTTDTVRKLASARVGEATVVGVAKGSGMIEPDMATLLAYFLTDAAVPRPFLDEAFRRVVDVTFNCLSIDTDTSTSDSAIVLANGAAGPIGAVDFEAALLAVSRSLVRQLAADGEGATKLIEVKVSSARDERQARRVAKAIVNSPLVKTAVHGADPNWGRVVMAIGKCSEDTDIRQDVVRVSFGGREVYPCVPDDEGLAAVAELMKGPEVGINVALGTGSATATVWGCDLSAEYVRINADYTT